MELREYLIDAMKARPEAPAIALDAVAVLDAAASAYTTAALRMHAAAVLNQFAETTDDDLDDGETLADRLLVLLMAEVDDNGDGDGDGEMSDGEQAMLEALFGFAGEYLAAHGVATEDAEALLNDGDASAATRARDVLAEALPEGDAGIGEFAFGPDDSEALFDGVMKKVWSFAHGVKTAITKRVSGAHKQRSPKQKMALRMARRKSHTSQANRFRAKSVKKRIKSGIGMKRKLA